MAISFEIDYKITGLDSLNTIYAGVHWAKRKNYKDCIAIITHNALRKCDIPKKPLNYPITIHFLYPPDNLDINNHGYFSKAVVDAMCGWVIIDDNKKYLIGWSESFYDGNKIKVVIKQRSCKKWEQETN